LYFKCGKFQIDFSSPLIMGIVNITPDSFFDGGSYFQPDAALAYAHTLIQQGADILDLGGESTRPGALAVSVQEELDRVMPVIEGLRGAPIPLSIDTSKPEVMRAAIAAGASMVNDINALQNPEALAVVAASEVAVCLMHKQGTPQTMQRQPEYQNVVEEVQQFLRERITAVQAAGVSQQRIIVDPGFGFGKTLVHNLALLQQLKYFSGLGMPLLVGLSHKSMLGAITGQDVAHRVHASVAAALLAVQRGANIVRVHDVQATADALKVWQAALATPSNR
jgi:dihydropteroate synthase